MCGEFGLCPLAVGGSLDSEKSSKTYLKRHLLLLLAAWPCRGAVPYAYFEPPLTKVLFNNLPKAETCMASHCPKMLVNGGVAILVGVFRV